MNLYAHLGIDAAQLDIYVAQGLVDVAEHDEFPLAMLTYGRKAVYDNVWDDVTTKCRSLIYNTETFEIVARSFEKFHNHGSPMAVEETYPAGEPEVWEKMDGFLCTLYTYNGESYIASKGSFHSLHAKWATGWYRKHENEIFEWPAGYTPVFEGITPNIRIVVDYGKREGLVLLGLVNIETGEELPVEKLLHWAYINKFEIPGLFNLSMKEATQDSFTDKKNFEGYVLVWRRPGKTPFRLKVKYIEYLRLHRFVTQVSPKRILEALSNGWDEVIDEYVNNSTPWFKHYVEKWKRVMDNEFQSYGEQAYMAFEDARKELSAPPYGGNLPTRKDWAEKFTTEANKPISAVLFAILDGKPVNQIVWKLVRAKVMNGKPLVDGRYV